MKMLWILTLFAIVSAAGAAVGWTLTRRHHDPLNSLAEFPLDEYRRDYHPIVGKEFKCRWRCEAQLAGRSPARLTVFTRAPDTWPITVLIPPGLIAGSDLVAGKNFSMEVSVEEGGLIYAKLCRAY